MLLLVVSIVVAAVVVGLLPRRGPPIRGGLAVLASLGACVWLSAQAPTVLGGTPIPEVHEWAPRLGVTAAFRLDALSLMFGLVITGIGAIICAYAASYVQTDRRTRGRLLSRLLFFEAAMLGVALADDVILLYVFWESTSISSFFLIGFDDEDPKSRSNALQALIVTAVGGLALLAGLLLLGVVASDGGATLTQARRLSELGSGGLTGHALYPTIVILVALGAFTKSAHVPFHFWLPAAMVAPTPVSAYLHSATMVKAGVYLLARLTPTLGGSPLWSGLLGAVGGVTMVVAGLLAITQRDLKLILAYSTITILGALTLALGIGHDKALQAFVLLLLAHALYKAALFMVAGVVDRATGSRDAYRGGALWRAMPVTTVVAVISAASMAGLPPLLGFLGKEGLYVAALEFEGRLAPLLVAGVVLAGTTLVVAASVAALGPFFRSGGERPRVRPVPLMMRFVPGLLVVGTLLLGVQTGWTGQLTDAVTDVIAGRPASVDVALWHGTGPPYGPALGASAASILVGLLGFAWLSHRPPSERAWGPQVLQRLRPGAVYERLYDGVLRLADATAAAVDGPLRHYLTVILLVVVGAAGVPLVYELSEGWSLPGDPPRIYEGLLAIIAIIGAITAVSTRHRLEAVAAIGATGLAIAFLFALLSAPDLAITQLMVETLFVIIAVLALYRIPPARNRLPGARPVRLIVAAAFGTMMAALVLAVGGSRFTPEASRYFVDHQLGGDPGKGANVVNTILAEYRALDTLGEITVLATASLGVYTLLRLAAGTRSATDEDGR